MTNIEDFLSDLEEERDKMVAEVTKMRLGDLDALKEDFKSRLADCNEWIEKAKDKETKIRASAIKAFIGEVIMTIDNDPTVAVNCKECDGYEAGYSAGLKDAERPQGKWVESHICSCGKILRMGMDVIEHKCKNCGRWSIKWARTIPDNFCSHCGAEIKKGGAE